MGTGREDGMEMGGRGPNTWYRARKQIQTEEGQMMGPLDSADTENWFATQALSNTATGIVIDCLFCGFPYTHFSACGKYWKWTDGIKRRREILLLLLLWLDACCWLMTAMLDGWLTRWLSGKLTGC